MIRTALTRVPNSLGQPLVLGVDGRAVAQAVELHHLLGQGDAVLGGLGPQHGQHRAQLLAGQRLVPGRPRRPRPG